MMHLISVLNIVKVFVLQTLPWVVAIFPAYLIVRAIILAVRRKKTAACISWKREIGLALFCLYMIFLLSATVFPEVSPSLNLYYPGGGFGTHNIRSDYINLIPGNIFMNIANSFQHYGGMTLWISILGNVMLFVPLGFLFSLLWSDSIKLNLLIGAGLSLLIELYQLFLPRATDIDDIWLNVLGILIGCLVLRLIRKGRDRRREKRILTDKADS